MRIIQVINVRWYNATAWYGLRLGTLLAQAGHEVTAVTLAGTPPEERAREMGLPIVPIDLNSSTPAGIVRAYARCRRLVSSFRPDVVNCHRGEAFFLWPILKKTVHPFKLVRTRGDRRPPRTDPVNRLLHNKMADAVVVTNTCTATFFDQSMGIPKDCLHLIHGGVDRVRFCPDEEGRKRVRREFGFADGDFVVGLLGRFDWVKGQRELIRAAALIRSRGLDNLRLLLIGHETAVSEAQVREWVREARLEDHVFITGLRSDVAACISALDLGVIASLGSEAVARAAFEIMSCGRPLVSTSVGVMPDLLPPEGLVEPGREEDLARIIERAARDEGFRRRLVQVQEGVLPEVSDEAFLAKSLAVYEGCLARKG